MGLLDWNDQEDDFFPDFNLGTSPPQTTSHMKHSLGSGRSLTTTNSNSSTTSSNTTRDRADSIASNTSSNASRKHLNLQIPSEYSSKANYKVARLARPRPKTRRSATDSSALAPKAPTHKHRPSFDLFGDDEELQDAESRIGFCEICLKHCDKHR